MNFVLSPPTLKQTAKGQVADLARSPRFGGLGSRASSQGVFNKFDSANTSAGSIPNAADSDSTGSKKRKGKHHKKESEAVKRSAFFGQNLVLSDASSSGSEQQDDESSEPVSAGQK